MGKYNAFARNQKRFLSAFYLAIFDLFTNNHNITVPTSNFAKIDYCHKNKLLSKKLRPSEAENS